MNAKKIEECKLEMYSIRLCAHAGTYEQVLDLHALHTGDLFIYLIFFIAYVTTHQWKKKRKLHSIVKKCNPDFQTHVRLQGAIPQSFLSEPLIFLHPQSGTAIFSSANDIIHKCGWMLNSCALAFRWCRLMC